MTRFMFLGGVSREGYSSGQMLPVSRGSITAWNPARDPARDPGQHGALPVASGALAQRTKPGNFSEKLTHGTFLRASRDTGNEVRAEITMLGTLRL